MVSTVVRAYDLGGFGDIAGAMRVASFLQRTGLSTQIKAKSESAFKKLQILGPDVEFKLNGDDDGLQKGPIQIDVAGHYKDDRVPQNRDIPHHFTEDMDNQENRRRVVPIYLKSGLQDHQVSVPAQIHASSPMFYRPFREWDLPKPHERDVRKMILEALFGKKELSAKTSILERAKITFRRKRNLESLLAGLDKFSFAHFSQYLIHPQDPEIIFNHPYFFTMDAAAKNSHHGFGIGLFLNGENEKALSRAAARRGWGVVDSNGHVVTNSFDHPNLIFLGPQPQSTTTGLFLSADMPNLVTGDLSLSDALYGLIAMDGPGFFYETPGWKVPTLIEMFRILEKQEPYSTSLFSFGSNLIGKGIPEDELEIVKTYLRDISMLFVDDQFAQRYAHDMREAVRKEIQRRFGDVQVTGNPDRDFYIEPGAPYLFQDATAQVVRTLQEDSEVLAETEEVRDMIANGVPVTVNVQAGVLEPTPVSSGISYKSYTSNYKEYFLHYIKYLNPDGEGGIMNYYKFILQEGSFSKKKLPLKKIAGYGESIFSEEFGNYKGLKYYNY